MSEPGMRHVDHIVEVKDGGSFWDPGNLRLVCRFHHFEKSVQTIAGRATGRSDQPSTDRYGRSYAPDGHWNDTPTGREPASPNWGLGCDNPACKRCFAEGYH
jgi:hypothetical protein